MSLRLPTRTLAPVVVLAVLAGIVATFVVARPPSAADETPSLVRPKLAKPAPARKPAPAKAKAKAPARPAAKPKPKPVAPAATPAEPAVPENGLPRALSTALAANRVVVVGLYDPDSPLDRMALAEARAGAGAADVGFVAINVLADSQSRPLLVKHGALENPGVLVYRRPDSLYARISGFADSETVAQAAANALR
ncbi:MAG TPA: hypothetical protein VHK46_08165 [Gaiellaceae bacterium]|jgi:hypothetical protein|nr:hypothetical protein [Gaiellaceae bacterium]